MISGFARVSTDAQNLINQAAQLKAGEAGNGDRAESGAVERSHAYSCSDPFPGFVFD